MTQDEKKRHAAEAALDYVKPEMTIGVGTGSTVDYFIECLARVRHKIDGAVANSEVTSTHLREHNIPIVDLTIPNPAPSICVPCVEPTGAWPKYLRLRIGNPPASPP